MTVTWLSHSVSFCSTGLFFDGYRGLGQVGDLHGKSFCYCLSEILTHLKPF